jgi:tetratricopeptide (TPR) repeat protein
MFETGDKSRLPILYEELGNAYDKLYSSMQESIQENLVKALDETTDINHQRALEFRIGNLHFDGETFSEADDFWKRSLKRVQESQITMKTILEKLIEKNKTNLSNDDEDNDDDENEDAEENTEDNEEAIVEDGEGENNESHSRVQSSKSQRRQSTKSIMDKEKPEELAQAYLDLEDYESALKYFKKYVAKLEDIFKPSRPEREIQDEQLPMIKFFHSLLIQTIDLSDPSASKLEEITDKDVWINLLQRYKEIFRIAVRLGKSSDDVAEANSAVFQISQKLCDIPDNLVTIHNILFNGDSDDIQWNELINLLSPDESNDILMRIAAYYVSKEAHETALQIYIALLNNIRNRDVLKSAVNYAILKLFELHLSADEDYRTNIISIDIHSPNIPVFDRILLCRLIISFWEELEDETTTLTFKKELLNLQNETWTIGDLETVDCIGHVLRKVEDHALACLYWSEVQNIYNEMLPNAIVTRLYAADSTFEQILQMTQQMNDDLSDNVRLLAESYESLAINLEKDNCEEDACESVEKAIIIWSKIPSEKQKVAQLKKEITRLKAKKNP